MRVGILSAAHLHVWSYANALKNTKKAEFVGLWDDDKERRQHFSEQTGAKVYDNFNQFIEKCDAVVITSENVLHAELGVKAAKASKHVLCEKPLVVNEEDGKRLIQACKQANVKLMTAFPCRFSPAYTRLRERVSNGDIGQIKAICATNQGRCPFGWFVEKEKSGGGAMIDHVVHVTDLVRHLLKMEVESVQAQIGHNMYGKEWEDTAMVTLHFPGGIFVTLDSSWSRPSSYKTWGNVNMNVVGEKGVIEMAMFGQNLDYYSNEANFHSQVGYGSDADADMVDAFLESVLQDKEPPVTGWDGLQAARVSLAGYESAKSGQVIAVNHQPV
ncbi:MAG TPA: Gfo/Idh/MocA family oxidoreductase [Fimbriimonadaceae bacterium]